MKKIATITGALALVFSAGAFAQSGNINIPGWGSASASAGTEVKNSTINVIGNKSTGTVTAGGGEVGGYGVTAKLSGLANVNSVHVTNSKVNDSTINVIGNESNTVNAVGGVANVNSVQLH